MSNNSFEFYADIYDAFYVDKNYKIECNNLINIAKSITLNLERCLEIGAGSGIFTKELAKQFNQIEAFELSPSMAKICANNLSNFSTVNVNQGDLNKTLHSKVEKFSIDMVVANFHVFTYFTNNEVDLFIEICKLFLRSGGIACFDFWDLDAVIANPPKSVTKAAIHKGRELTRKTFPSSNNLFTEVEVNFEFYDKSTLLFKESHRMHPRSLNEVKARFEESFVFHGSFDISTGESYSQKNYGNLVFFEKK